MTHPERRWSRLSLRVLLLSTSFVGAGVGCYFASFREFNARHYHTTFWPAVVAMVQMVGAGPLIGAGLLLPFRRARVGAYVGFFAPIVVLICYEIVLFGWESVASFQGRLIVALTALVLVLGASSTVQILVRRRRKESHMELRN